MVTVARMRKVIFIRCDSTLASVAWWNMVAVITYYRMHRFHFRLNVIKRTEDEVVLLRRKKRSLCVGLTVRRILCTYVQRWLVEGPQKGGG